MFLKDRLKIATKRTYTDEGFLIVPARIGRIGIQEYLAVEMGITDREPNSIIRVYRPAEEVFSDESLQSFTNKPVTNNHPPVLVDATNYTEYSVGHSGPDVSRDGMFADTTLFIKDAETIARVEEGKVELSNGYTSDIEFTSGITPEGESYDAIQRNIKGNHIAIVERGRAGPACRVADNLPSNGDQVIMAKITIDGVDFEVSDQAGQAVIKLQGKLTDAEKEVANKEKEMEDKEEEMDEAAKEAKAKEDSLNAELDDAESKILTADSLDKTIEERSKFVDQVSKIVPDIKWQGKDSMTLKREAVAAKRPDVQMDSVSDEYINVSFDMLVEAISNNSQHNMDEALINVVNNDKDKDQDNRSAATIARDKMISDSQAAWKSKGDK
tara:strand:- start:13743 stop:14894 length:1152 start_codon:yes stop_codon:yes gene_type:complete